MTDKGLYIHIPFCSSKCPYCDFYSFIPKGKIIDDYVDEIIRRLRFVDYSFDTVYFGGGTPSLIGSERIASILENVKKSPDCEITIEANPSHLGKDDCDFDFEKLVQGGVNRVSLGLQSAVDSERKALGRVAGVRQAETAIDRIKRSGIDNISLDLMLGVSGQTKDSLLSSLDFCVNAGVRHISAYILKIEEGTPYSKMQARLNLPGEDEVCDFYLTAADELEKAGFLQYEISNFALPGFESRHNLKYWHDEEYLGLGPAAHSFIDGKRFYFERDINSFLCGCEPVPDGDGGDAEEYVMLALRLVKGLNFAAYKERFGTDFPESAIKKARLCPQYINVDDKGISFSKEGFLLSNRLICMLCEEL